MFPGVPLGVACTDASQPAAGGTAQRWDSQGTRCDHVALPWLPPCQHLGSTPQKLHGSGGTAQSRGKATSVTPSPTSCRRAHAGLPASEQQINLQEGNDANVSFLLACVHARKGQFYLGAVRVTSLSFSSSQSYCLKTRQTQTVSESQSYFWSVSGMGTEMLFWRDKYQSHCPQGMGQGPGHSWQQ